MPLTPDDLAYMREVQADHRPTEAELIPKGSAPDGLGGRTKSASAPVPLAIRIDTEAEVPDALATEFGQHLVRITADLTPVKHGDQVKVSPTEVYQIVSAGDTDPWTTAQRLWAKRTVWPA